ncbi:MAG: HNH endonuclease [Bacilli bacterium]|nr:HNH endonuclease [Bacilli bacterium]
MRHKYSEEEDDFLKNNVKGISIKELTNMFNKKFNYNLSVSAIENRKTKLKIKSGINPGRFKKGNTPFNKGMKWDEYLPKKSQIKCSKTSYKKGNIPTNYKKVGSEKINNDGYVVIKTKDPNEWELKHRYLYKKNKGDIPKGYKIIFADGNKKNFDLNNLIMVSNGEEMMMNKFKLFSKDKDITKTGTLIAKLIVKGSKLKNERL